MYEFDWSVIPHSLPFLLDGAKLTFTLLFWALLGGLAWGTLLALAASKIGQRDSRLVELYLFAGAAYFVVSFVASQLVKRLEESRAA